MSEPAKVETITIGDLLLLAQLSPKDPNATLGPYKLGLEAQTFYDFARAAMTGIATTLDELEQRVAKHQLERNGVYTERNALVCALSKLYPSHLADHPAWDEGWDPEWLNVVCIHGPTGQMTWHIHRLELDNFEHLPRHPNDWDGHTTEEKYARLKQL